MPKINSWVILTAFSLLLFLPGLNRLPVTDRDEAHFAQASRQMLQTGNYFQIRFQDKTRFQKPPGINWLQAASVRLFSDGDASVIWPYRIPSLLGALLSVLLMYFFSRRFVAERTALLAAGLLASSLLLIVEAHIAVIDTSLLSSVLLMQGALWVIYHNGMNDKKSHWGWALIFWLAMAYGLVLKGVTPLVGGLSILTLCVLERRINWLRGFRITWGLLLFVALSLTWLMLVNAAEQSNYLLQMLHKDLLPKLQGGHESHGQPPFFHLAILPLTFWPASLFLWQGARYAFKNKQDPVVRFLLSWILPTWIFFEIMPTKLPQYVLPTFPAIALLCALGVMQSVKFAIPTKFERTLQILWGGLSVALAIAIMLLPYFIINKVTFISVLLFFIISLMSAACVFIAWHGAYRRASVAALLTALLAFPMVFSGLLPQLKPLWISKNVTSITDKHQLSEKNPLLVLGFGEPSLVFYLNTHHVAFIQNQELTARVYNNPHSLILIEETNFAKIANSFPQLTILDQMRGFNYSKGRWMNLLVVGINNKEKNK